MNKSKSSIIIFTDKYPYSLSESFFKDELEYISASFDKITIIPFEKGNAEIVREIPENVNLIRPVYKSVKNKQELVLKGIFNFSIIFPFIKEFIRKGLRQKKFSVYNWIVHLLIIRSTLAYIKKTHLPDQIKNADILYFYWGLRWSQVLPFLPIELKSKIVVRFHGTDLYENLNSNYIPFREQQLRRLNLAVFVSETGKNYLSDRYPFIKEHSIIARLGTFDTGLNPYSTQNRIHIVSCSNLVPVKRVYLIAKSLSFTDINIKWTHLGDGVQMNEIKELVKLLPENIEVELPGGISHNELLNYYKNNPIHIFLNVSSSEGVPVSVMEALSFGIPVIATNAGGTCEIVNDKVGLLVDINITPYQLSSKIKELVYSEKYINLRTNARNQWERLCRADVVYPQFIGKLKGLIQSMDQKTSE